MGIDLEMLAESKSGISDSQLNAINELMGIFGETEKFERRDENRIYWSSLNRVYLKGYDRGRPHLYYLVIKAVYALVHDALVYYGGDCNCSAEHDEPDELDGIYGAPMSSEEADELFKYWAIEATITKTKEDEG